MLLRKAHVVHHISFVCFISIQYLQPLASHRRLVSFMPWQSALVSIPFVKGGESVKNRFADPALHATLSCIHA